MTNPVGRFVEVPGLSGKIRQRWVDLPIERRMSLDALRPLGLLAFASLVAFVVGSVVMYRDMTTDAWSTCTAGRIGELLHGSICHRRYFGFLILSLLCASFFGAALWKAARRIVRVIARPGLHLRVDGETFWCEQLIEPIHFTDILEVRKNTVRFIPQSVTFVLNTPPDLAYGKHESVDTWRGNKPAFTFERLGYLKGGELVDTIAFLAQQHRKP
jgi:hypothetical protein